MLRGQYILLGWGETSDSYTHSLYGSPSWDVAPFQVPAEKYQRGNKKTKVSNSNQDLKTHLVWSKFC